MNIIFSFVDEIFQIQRSYLPKTKLPVIGRSRMKRTLSIIPQDDLHESENCPVAGAAFFPSTKKMGVPMARVELGRGQV